MLLNGFSGIKAAMRAFPIPVATGLVGTCRWVLPRLMVAGIMLLTLAPLMREHSVLMDFLAHFLVQSAVLSVAIGLCLLTYRRWVGTGLVALCLIVQASLLQPDFLAASAAHPTPTSVRVLFSNVWTRNRQLEAYAEQIRAHDPDIVVLAELNARTTVLIDELGSTYPYSVDCLQHWACDSVVLSRLPIVEDLSGWSGDHRVATSAARIAAPFGPFVVAGVHLDRPLPPRRLQRQEHQVDGLVTLLASIDSPLLLVGDFNASPWGRLLPSLASKTGLELAWGLEGTWPAQAPWPMRIPIDHALTGRGLALLDREVVRLPGSDHRALLLRIGLRDGERIEM